MAPRPNILFIIADDHRFSAIRAHGDPNVQTPVLDALVEHGVSFQRNHMMGGLHAAVSVPARSCLLTGVNPFRASASHTVNDPALLTIRPELPLWPEVFRRAGYATHFIGKWHNDPQSLARGFAGGEQVFLDGMSDHWNVPVHDFDPTGRYAGPAAHRTGKHSSDLFSEAARRFLRDYHGHEPFLLYLAFTAPHDPRTAPPMFARRYAPEAIELPPNCAPQHPFDNGDLRVRDEQLAPWPRTPEVVRQHLADYYAMITHLDACIGRVLATLHGAGHADDTIVVYTSDHGLAVGQHGLMGKQNLYDHSVRVPLILRGPGLPRDRRVAPLTQTYDLFPTLCELTGVELPSGIESRSLVPLLEIAPAPIRDSVCAAYQDLQRMISDGRWKLIRYYQRAGTTVGENRLQLFDLAADPWEIHNLASLSHSQPRLDKLAAELAAWQRHVGDPWADRPVLLPPAAQPTHHRRPHAAGGTEPDFAE